MKCRRFSAALVLLLLCSCSLRRGPVPTTVAAVDLERYLGVWYEIASRPNMFQRDCVSTQARYSWSEEEGKIKVENFCRDKTLDGPVRKVEGTARVVDPETNAKLKVQFFWPFEGDYWILELHPDYRWALVGTPSRKYFWILSRSRQLDPKVTQMLMARAESLGYPVKEAQYTLQRK